LLATLKINYSFRSYFFAYNQAHVVNISNIFSADTTEIDSPKLGTVCAIDYGG
jgi:hypothetical protein